MTDSMVERVARAIWGDTEYDAMISEATRDDGQPNDASAWREVEAMRESAQRAMTALRVPTEAMLIAAREWSRNKYGKPIGNDAASGCWQAMIDTALEQRGLEG